MKKYTAAPLPFVGQKRRFLTDFVKALPLFADTTTFVDLFGGSGLLSHAAKCARPDAEVIYNDFDNYAERLANIEHTNTLITDLREILANVPKGGKVPEKEREAALARILADDMSYPVDYCALSGNLLYSMRYATSYAALSRQGLFYNRIVDRPYSAEGYLEGVTRVSCDYRELFDRYKNQPGVTLIADPPYLSTEITCYNTYWRLSTYLNVLSLLDGRSFFYFLSDKSNIQELLDWLDAETGWNPLRNATTISRAVRLNKGAAYNDMMMYRP